MACSPLPEARAAAPRARPAVAAARRTRAPLVWLVAVLLGALAAGAQQRAELERIGQRLQELSRQVQACGANMACVQPLVDEMTQLGNRAAELNEQMQGSGQQGQPGAQPAAAMSPELQRLNDRALQVDMEMDPLTQCLEINRAAEEILREIRGRVSPEIQGVFLPIRFCRQTQATIQETGHGRSDSWDISYQIESRMDAAWTDSYFVRPGTDKAHFRGFTLYTPGIEETRDGVRVLQASGSILMADGPRLTRAAPTRWEIRTGAALVIGPVDAVVGSDPESWPDEIVSRYLVSPVTPVVYFLPPSGTPPSPVPCLKGYADQTHLTADELWAGVTGDELRVVLRDVSSDPFCLSCTTVITVGMPPGQCDPAVVSPDTAVVADGDCLDHGGTVLASDDGVFVNGRKVARVGDPALCRQHGLTHIVRSGAASVFATGDPVARIGDVTECGARIVGGSPDTFVGGG